MKHFEEYLERLSRNKSKNTVVNYTKHIQRFMRWLDEPPESFEMDQEVYLDYIDDLKANYAPTTVHAHMNAIYSYLNFLLRKGYISKLPFFDSKELGEFLPVIEKQRKQSLSQTEIKKVISNADDALTELIIRVMYDGALRVSELVSLKWNDIEDDGTVAIRGKGKGGMSKLRYVHFTEATMNKIRKHKLQSHPDNEYVFVSARTKKPFSTRRIEQFIDKVSKSSGLDIITTHTFRGSQATHLIENGMPIEFVADYLGHVDINTTRTYVDLTREMQNKLNNCRNTI